MKSNQAEITLKVTPNLWVLTEMNFNQYLWMVIKKSTTSYNNISMSSSYSDDGTITVLVSYNEHIEGNDATLILGYNPTLIGLDPTVLTFKMVGYNAPLNYSE